MIENGVNLEISPGATVKFQDFYNIEVRGSINAVGTADSRITFTADNPENFQFDETETGSWNGIDFYETSTMNESSVFNYCIFEYSKDTEEVGKGGVFFLFEYSNLKVLNSIFRNNYSTYGGAVYCTNFSSPIINNCLFYLNYGKEGGSALMNHDSYPQLINNTLTANVVTNPTESYRTGVIHNIFSKPLTKNNIIWNNYSNYYVDIQIMEPKAFYSTYNNIQFGLSGVGNIEEDPRFTDDNSHNYTLSENSPCIDAGDPDFLNTLCDTDLAGN